MMGFETERRTIRIRKDLINKIKDMAEKDNRSWNNMVEVLLNYGIKSHIAFNELLIIESKINGDKSD